MIKFVSTNTIYLKFEKQADLCFPDMQNSKSEISVAGIYMKLHFIIFLLNDLLMISAIEEFFLSWIYSDSGKSITAI